MIQAVLGGVALGASLAALADSLRRAPQPEALGQGVVSAGPSSGGPFGGGPGVVSGPGPSGPSFGGPTVSVAPGVVGPGDRQDFFFDDTFYWPGYWPGYSPYSYDWPYALRRPVRLVCRMEENGDDNGEQLICQRAYPLVPVAWGPPAAFM